MLYLSYVLWLCTVWWHLSVFTVVFEQKPCFPPFSFSAWLSVDKVTQSSPCVCWEHSQPDICRLWQVVFVRVQLWQTFPCGCQKTTPCDSWVFLSFLPVCLISVLILHDHGVFSLIFLFLLFFHAQCWITFLWTFVFCYKSRDGTMPLKGISDPG